MRKDSIFNDMVWALCEEHDRLFFDVRFHFVWISKYRKPLVRGIVARKLRGITEQFEFEINTMEDYAQL